MPEKSSSWRSTTFSLTEMPLGPKESKMSKSTLKIASGWLISLLGIMLIATSVAHAQPSTRFPDHQSTQIDGVRYEAFDLGGFTRLLELDVDLEAATILVDNLQRSLEATERSMDLLDLAYASALADVDLLQSERDRLETQWAEENKLRLEAENRPNVGLWVGWGLAAAFAVALVSVIVTVSVTD